MSYFDEYVQNYDMNDERVDYKYHHSYRVMNNMSVLAKSLNLSSEDTKLAKLIGLLHDIGRFEQNEKYHTYKDDFMDHGDYGADILIKDNLIKHFNIEPKDYQVVYKSIKNHNKFKIANGLTKRELLFTKLIRDADKLDILYALGNQNLKPTLNQDNQDINSHIKATLVKRTPISYEYVSSKNDSLAMVFGLVYDLNFDISYQIIYQGKYLDKIYQRITNQAFFKEIYLEANAYLKERNEE